MATKRCRVCGEALINMRRHHTMCWECYAQGRAANKARQDPGVTRTCDWCNGEFATKDATRTRCGTCTFHTAAI